MALQIDVLTIPGCPNAEPALRLVRSAVRRLAPDARLRETVIDDPAEAERLGFPGSPTVRMDGIDIERTDAVAGSLACRTYDGGRLQEWLVEAALLRAHRPRHTLFLCVANSARSQMAEGIARSLAPPGVTISSAGSAPADRVHPLAVRALAELGLDIAGHRPKVVDEVAGPPVDAVITLCAEEICPAYLGQALRVHWGLPDPAGGTGPEEERLEAFRRVRDELRRRLERVFAT